MLIRYGFDLEIMLWQPTTLITAMDVHESQRQAIVWENEFETSPSVRVQTLFDQDGNKLRRLTADPGILGMKLTGVVRNSGALDASDPHAELVPVETCRCTRCPIFGQPLLRDRAAIQFCLGCFRLARRGLLEGSGRLRLRASPPALQLSGGVPTRTAAHAMEEQVGVCRDFTHLAVTLCRCLNIPARYCNGYLGDIGVPPDPAPMDFNAWFEAYIGGRWYTFDPRHNKRRIGRILIARGRDAADVPMITSFGPHKLTKFEVITQEIPQDTALAA